MTLLFYLSGGVSNPNPNASLGGVKSSIPVVNSIVENVLDNVTKKEITVNKTEYRLFYIHNSHGSIPVRGGVIYITSYPISTEVTIGLDPAGAGNGSTTGVAQTISTEDTAPIGVDFEDAGEFKCKVPIPLLRAGESVGIWVKRISSGSGGSGTISVGLYVPADESALTIVTQDATHFSNSEGVSIGERTAMAALDLLAKVGYARIGFSQIV